MYKKRHLEAKILGLAKHAKVILVVGARQVGKSTLLKKLFPNYQHFTFDAFQDIYNVKTDPDLFLNQFKEPIILDEIQYQPELISAIKRKVDNSDKPGQYFLTGSQNFSVIKHLAESLAGRVTIVTLYPLTPHEIQDTPETHWLPTLLQSPRNLIESFKGTLPISLWQTLWQGGFPGLLSLPKDLIGTTLQSYLQTYVERDIRLLENIRDLREFDRFIQILAGLTAQEIFTTQLGREIGISHTTAARWLNLLTYTYQWNEIPPYFNNTIKQVSKKSKGILCDTGVASFLLRLSSPESVGSYIKLGALFETHIINQIIAVSSSLDIAPNLFHWRSKSGSEVDLILDLDNKLFPIEIKCKSIVSKQDTRGISAFKNTYQNKNIEIGIIIYAGDRCFWIDDSTLALPFNSMMK